MTGKVFEKFRKQAVLLFISMMLCYWGHAQKDSTGRPDTNCVQKDVADLIRKALKKAPKNDAGKAGSIILVPIIGSNPATGFMIGVGGQYGFRLKGEKTNYSLISGSVQLTTKGQKLFLLKNTIFTINNKLIFTGDWRFQIYSQSTYGLGTNAPEEGGLNYHFNLLGQETTEDSLAQPLQFNFYRFYQSVSFQIKNSFYIGTGYYLDSYSKIVDEKLRLDSGNRLITSHYSYNKLYGYDTAKYTVSTLNFNIVSDTRDNLINAYKGHYFFFNWRTSLKLFGTNSNTSIFYTEWRSFHSLSKRNPRHLIGFWLMGDFSSKGELPYLILPATAYDQRSRSARGYTQGRFRGDKLIYGETEYRFPISACTGVLGGVMFVNATTASNPQGLKLFNSIQPGYGMGLRIMVDKKTRTNLAVDFAFGNKSSGFYLAASETF
ncbi:MULTISPECIES: BamA/TamA family outer membrane protein [Niastella]|uniref:BamA/TamA family outer membrane protein n=1 Tax=Niastella soli TaxID=2821487 RepID=A0ABS3YW39_9BACT|nr:BamA/TamA family outer membrane protein [Niastella soli]MBO9202103.1 BamA/TamA family outer membrane protein [Niastella soli]